MRHSPPNPSSQELIDLYDYLHMPQARIGRPFRHDLSTWTVTDDWPEPMPVTAQEVEVFETWFGDLFDELFGTNS